MCLWHVKYVLISVATVMVAVVMVMMYHRHRHLPLFHRFPPVSTIPPLASEYNMVAMKGAKIAQLSSGAIYEDTLVKMQKERREVWAAVIEGGIPWW